MAQPDVLSLLQQYLAQAQPGAGGATNVAGILQDPNNPQPIVQDWDAIYRAMAGKDAAARAQLPPGLPDVVVRAILGGGGGYGEGETPSVPPNPALAQETIDNLLAGSPQREQYLNQQVAQARENQWRQRLGLPFGGQATQFASPLNQMMPRQGMGL